MSKAKKLIVCCGGTGGHFYPGLSVARAFKERGGAAKLFLIGRHSHKQSLIAASVGVEAEVLSMLPPPVGIMGKIKFLTCILFRIAEAKQYLLKEKPDFVLGMGSFTSIPSILAAKKLGILIYLHDGNSYVGKANIFLSRYAEKIGVAFPPVNSDKFDCPFEITGMPLRSELSPVKVQEKYGDKVIEALNKEFKVDFSADKPVVLVFGGSQGAGTFNSIIPEAFALMDREDMQIIHISGAGNKDDVKEAYREVQAPFLVIDGTEEMCLLYEVADLVICRAGGSTIAELALFGKCAILIPYPFATNDHQRVNAEFYTSKGKSLIIKDADLVPAEFAEILINWLDNKEKFIKQAAKSKELAHPRAAEAVIEMMGGEEGGE